MLRINTWRQAHATRILEVGKDIENPPVGSAVCQLSRLVVFVGLNHLLQFVRDDALVIHRD